MGECPPAIVSQALNSSSDSISTQTRLPDQIEIIARPYRPDNDVVPKAAPSAAPRRQS